MSSALPQRHPLAWKGSVLLAQLKMLTVVVVVAEELKHNIEKQEVHIVEVLVPMRNLCGSPN